MPKFAQVCELVQTLSSLMRQSVPPAGLFRELESASLVREEVWRGPRGAKNETAQTSPQTGASSCLNIRNAMPTGSQLRRCCIKFRSAAIDVDIFDWGWLLCVEAQTKACSAQTQRKLCPRPKIHGVIRCYFVGSSTISLGPLSHEGWVFYLYSLVL